MSLPYLSGDNLIFPNFFNFFWATDFQGHVRSCDGISEGIEVITIG